MIHLYLHLHKDFQVLAMAGTSFEQFFVCVLEQFFDFCVLVLV